MNLVKFVCVLVGRNAPPPISSKNNDFHLPVKLVRFPNCHEASGLGNLTTVKQAPKRTEYGNTDIAHQLFIPSSLVSAK